MITRARLIQLLFSKIGTVEMEYRGAIRSTAVKDLPRRSLSLTHYEDRELKIWRYR